MELNLTTTRDLSPNGQRQPRLAPATCYAAGELPDQFQVIVKCRDLALADNHTRATAYDEWMAAKSELRKRGYDVWESFNQNQNAYVADCTKRHNIRS